MCPPVRTLAPDCLESRLPDSNLLIVTFYSPARKSSKRLFFGWCHATHAQSNQSRNVIARLGSSNGGGVAGAGGGMAENSFDPPQIKNKPEQANQRSPDPPAQKRLSTPRKSRH